MSEKKKKRTFLNTLIFIAKIIFIVIVALHILLIAYSIISYANYINQPPRTWVESYHYYEAYTVKGDAIYILTSSYRDSGDYMKIYEDVIEEVNIAKDVSEGVFSEVQPKAKLIAEESHNILANQFTSPFQKGYEHLADEVFKLNVQGLTREDKKPVGLAFKLFEREDRIYGFVNVYSEGASGRNSVAFEDIVKTCLVEFEDGKMSIVKEIEGVVSIAYNESLLVYYNDDGVHTMNMASGETKLIIEGRGNEHRRYIYTRIWDNILLVEVLESYDDENGKYHLAGCWYYAFKIDGSELTEVEYIQKKS